ncbi:MAG: sigma-70 family RNA polymerase sigma factor [Rhodocyclaceae bacterium]|nr:sigma-70 family RNA polymerase sigma factor [Rhodocyclaceae bacterium]
MPDPTLDSLADLLARTALGDRDAFRMLYDATSPRLFGIAVGLLRRRELAEEVLQESFVSIWHRAGSYRPGSAQPISWLIAIVRNQALDRLRHSGRRPEEGLPDLDEVADDAPDAPTDPLNQLERSVDALHVRACLDDLRGSPRQCLALAFYRGLTHSEMASHLDAPLGSVKVWLRRGLERLKRCLEALP